MRVPRQWSSLDYIGPAMRDKDPVTGDFHTQFLPQEQVIDGLI
jgi:hypothetical protein